MDRIIESSKSVVVAADVPLNDLETLMKAVWAVPGIDGVKLGITAGLQGLAIGAQVVRNYTGSTFPIIYDHQKAGTDIPAMSTQFVSTLKDAGVTAAILFPFAGPATQEAWTKGLLDAGIKVLTGFVMTHEKFLVSEGGYIADEAVPQAFRNACRWGCSDFVVPGTKLSWVERIRGWVAEELGEGNYDLYAPGFIEQGGVISECAKKAGPRWHAIVGSAIYGKKTVEAMHEAAIEITRQIVATA